MGWETDEWYLEYLKLMEAQKELKPTQFIFSYDDINLMLQKKHIEPLNLLCSGYGPYDY